MAETPHYNLQKPNAGDSGWAPAMNGNLDTIDAQMKANADSIINHTGNGDNKHTAEQIRTADGSNLESEIATIKTGKSDINHTHNQYASISHNHSEYALQSDLETLENTLDLLLPDLSSISINATITNRSSGIRIVCGSTPSINITNWMVSIAKDSNVVCEVISSSNYFFIHEESMNGVEDDDFIEITITAISGQSTKSQSYSHQFQHINSDIEERLNSVEIQLTIGNVIDAFAQDADALQALANVLHSSNTLAQKVAELS